MFFGQGVLGGSITTTEGVLVKTKKCVKHLIKNFCYVTHLKKICLSLEMRCAFFHFTFKSILGLAKWGDSENFSSRMAEDCLEAGRYISWRLWVGSRSDCQSSVIVHWDCCSSVWHWGNVQCQDHRQINFYVLFIFDGKHGNSFLHSASCPKPAPLLCCGLSEFEILILKKGRGKYQMNSTFRTPPKGKMSQLWFECAAKLGKGAPIHVLHSGTARWNHRQSVHSRN